MTVDLPHNTPIPVECKNGAKYVVTAVDSAITIQALRKGSLKTVTGSPLAEDGELELFTNSDDDKIVVTATDSAGAIMITAANF